MYIYIRREGEIEARRQQGKGGRKRGERFDKGRRKRRVDERVQDVEMDGRTKNYKLYT